MVKPKKDYSSLVYVLALAIGISIGYLANDLLLRNFPDCADTIRTSASYVPAADYKRGFVDGVQSRIDWEQDMGVGLTP
jgi:hypothetical protein